MDAVELLQQRRRRSSGAPLDEITVRNEEYKHNHVPELDEEQMRLRSAIQRVQSDMVHELGVLRRDTIAADKKVAKASMVLPMLHKRLLSVSSNIKEEKLDWMRRLKPLEKQLEENMRSLQNAIQMREEMEKSQAEIETKQEEKIRTKIKQFETHVDEKLQQLMSQVDAGQEESKQAWKVMETGAREAASANEDVIARKKRMEELRSKVDSLTKSKDELLQQASNLVSDVVDRKIVHHVRSAIDPELEEAESSLEKLNKIGPKTVQDAIRDEIHALETAVSETQAEDSQSLRQLRYKIDNLRGQVKRMDAKWQNLTLFLNPPSDDNEHISESQLRILAEKMSLLEERVEDFYGTNQQLLY